MGHAECISPLKQAMQARKDMIGVVCEALNRLFSTNHDQLISQVDAQYLQSVSAMN
jgi:hypothetical protein